MLTRYSYIHGMDESYNDIQTWRFKDLVAAFGADPEKSRTFQIKTKQEAHDLFNDKEFSSAPYLQVSLQALISITIQYADSAAVRRIIYAEGGRSGGTKADGGGVREDQREAVIPISKRRQFRANFCMSESDEIRL